MTPSYLALYFDAPMQSWGGSSRFERRASLAHPTRSGVTGIICAALGIERNDNAFLLRMRSVKMDMYVLPRKISSASNEFFMTRSVDYHTVGGGYNEKNPAERMHIPRQAADGRPKGTALTYREYLHDICFGVILTADDSELLEKIEKGLHDPVWGVWLGRKCCIPCSRICEGFFESKEKALQKLCGLAGCDKPSLEITDAVSFEEGDETIFDIPITFERSKRGTNEAFLPRRIKKVVLK
ncbi:MAG: type I-E CRISPR-associated protein Cas5/CasD [Thermoguttaceae bacterium]